MTEILQKCNLRIITNLAKDQAMETSLKQEKYRGFNILVAPSNKEALPSFDSFVLDSSFSKEGLIKDGDLNIKSCHFYFFEKENILKSIKKTINIDSTYIKHLQFVLSRKRANFKFENSFSTFENSFNKIKNWLNYIPSKNDLADVNFSNIPWDSENESTKLEVALERATNYLHYMEDSYATEDEVEIEYAIKKFQKSLENLLYEADDFSKKFFEEGCNINLLIENIKEDCLQKFGAKEPFAHMQMHDEIFVIHPANATFEIKDDKNSNSQKSMELIANISNLLLKDQDVDYHDIVTSDENGKVLSESFGVIANYEKCIKISQEEINLFHEAKCNVFNYMGYRVNLTDSSCLILKNGEIVHEEDWLSSENKKEKRAMKIIENIVKTAPITTPKM